MFGDPYFSFQKQILITIISTLSKNEQKNQCGKLKRFHDFCSWDMESCHLAAARRMKLWSLNANLFFKEPKQLTKFTWWVHISLQRCNCNIFGLIQLFRESLSRIKCTRQSRKVIWDMINTLFLTTVAVDPTFVTFLQHSQTYISGLPYDSFKFLWKTVHLKSPTIPFRIAACTFSDNLSQNSCRHCGLIH